MSIGFIAAAEPPGWVLWAWLASAAAVAGVTLRRPAAGAAETPAGLTERGGPLLVITAVVGLLAWFAGQVAWFTAFPPVVRDGTVAKLSPADLSVVTTLAAFVGFAAMMVVLSLVGGRALVGYGPGRVGRGVVIGLVGAFVVIPFTLAAAEGTIRLWSAIGYEHPAEHELLDAMRHTPAAWVRALSVVSAVVAAPLYEELLFRGCVQNAARRFGAPAVVAVLASSVPFTLIHAPWTMPAIFVFAVLVGVTYERTRNLWATTVMHAAFNGFSVAMSLTG